MSYGCQKNQVLPKIPDQAAYYYSRQFYIYNFSICKEISTDKQSKENTYIYTWTEADAAKGSAQIASAVFHRLQNIDLNGINFLQMDAQAKIRIAPSSP